MGSKMKTLQSRTGFRTIIAGAFLFALAACTSTDATLGVDTTAQATPPVSVPTDGATQISSLQPDAAVSNVYFAPIVGAPVANVTALSKRLSSAAASNSIKLQPSGASTIDHEIRGYFSAFSESGQTTVIHVWDVFSPQGQRVHRIQGQEKINGTGSDPWAVVPPAAMERIADSVLSQYAAWRSTS